VQVKRGYIGAHHVRDLIAVLERRKADIAPEAPYEAAALSRKGGMRPPRPTAKLRAKRATPRVHQ
jgi:hypothetical protein